MAEEVAKEGLFGIRVDFTYEGNHREDEECLVINLEGEYYSFTVAETRAFLKALVEQLNAIKGTLYE